MDRSSHRIDRLRDLHQRCVWAASVLGLACAVSACAGEDQLSSFEKNKVEATGDEDPPMDTAAAEPDVTVTFPLRGTQAIPATDSPARGSCTAVLSGAHDSLVLTCAHEVTGATAAHVHFGVAGVGNGATVIDLGAAASPISLALAVTSTQASDFLNGNWYLDVHSNARPAGELRGQISSSVVRFPIQPRQETPPITTSYGTGSCAAYLSPNQAVLSLACTHSLPFQVAPTAAQIRRGAPGVAGAVVASVGTGALSPFTGSVALAPADLADLLAGNLYLELASRAFPRGEMRGQIAQLIDSRGAGEQVVPATSSRASLNCTSYLAPSGASIALSCAHDIGGAIGAAVSVGAPGTNGSVLADLGNGLSPINATVPLAPADLASFLAGDLYVSVMSATSTKGEARAQLSTNFSFPIDGDQHIPPRVTPHTGHCLAHMNPAETTLRFECTHNIPADDVNRAHMHRCNATCSGPIYSADFVSFTSPFAATVALNATDAAAALDGNFYLHVHSKTFRNEGELRGQIADIYDFPLQASQVAPVSTSTASGACRAFVSVSDAPSFALRCTHTVGHPTGAHLHRGLAGSAGPMMQMASPTGTSPILFGTRLSGFAAGLLRSRQAYIDVHSTSFPQGEVRGQIVR